MGTRKIRSTKKKAPAKKPARKRPARSVAAAKAAPAAVDKPNRWAVRAPASGPRVRGARG